MATKPKSGKILTSKEDVLSFLGVGEVVLQHFIKLKLPVTMINGRMYAHADVLDQWMAGRLAAQQRLEVPE